MRRASPSEVAEVMRANPHVANVHFDWEEKSKVIKVDIDQEKARLLGLSSQDLSAFLNTSLNGLTVTYYRERDKQVEVLLRGDGGRARPAFAGRGPGGTDPRPARPGTGRGPPLPRGRSRWRRSRRSRTGSRMA